MKRKKIIIILALCCLMAGLSAGRYAGDFMLIGAGVRPLGMGGAFAAVADDGNAIYWNAAGIAQLRQSNITIMQAFLYNGLASYQNISFCQPLPNDVTIGLNLTRFTVDNIPIYLEKYLLDHPSVDERINNGNFHLSGIPDGYFRSSDIVYQFAFSKHIHYDLNMGWLFFAIPLDTYLGANIKYIKRDLKDISGSGTGFDLSFLLRSDLETLFDIEGLGNIAFGVNFQDVAGTEITWSNLGNFHKDEILFNTKMGLSIDQPLPALKSKVTLAYDVDYVYGLTHHVGLDWDYDSRANIRIGYYDSNFTAGASIKVYGVCADYALITNPLGLTNRVGLRIDF